VAFCEECHGENREGGRKVPPLNQVEFYHSRPGALFGVLRKGSLHTGMPSFAHLPEPSASPAECKSKEEKSV